MYSWNKEKIIYFSFSCVLSEQKEWNKAWALILYQDTKYN